MNPLAGPHNNSYPGQVDSAVRLNWSQRRAWHGDTVKIFVQTKFTKTNPAVEVTVLAKDSDALDKPGGATLSDYSAGYSYTVKWKGKSFGAHREFVLKAKVAEKLESAASEPLYVDLDTPSFSS